MRKSFTPLMIFGLIWLGIILLSWFVFPGWAQIPGGVLTLAGLTAIGVIAFIKDGYSFIKDFVETRRIIDADAQQIDNHDLFPDDDSQITNVRWNARDTDMVSNYIDLCCKVDSKFSENKVESRFLQYCLSMGLARSVGESTFLTQAGVLLFCKKHSFPHAKFHIDVIFKDHEHDLSKEFSASILESYLSILELLKPLTVEWRDPSKREKTGQESTFFFYPLTAIVESLVNFFIHRDYKKENQGYITIYPDKIEFENPGQSLYPINELINATHSLKPQYKRNPRLIQALRKTGLNQREGGGIIRIKRELKKNESIQPDGSLGLIIENDPNNDRFRLIIFKKLPPTHSARNQEIIQVSSPLFTIPLPVKDFTGRDGEIASLKTSFKNGALISGVSGGGGIGKTQLARKFAQEISGNYPDAHISIDLRGTSDPLSPHEAMRRILEPFYPNQKLPDEPEQVAGLYQQTFSSQKVLLLLDNASNTAQVRPLIPPAPSAAIVTSRQYFSLTEFDFIPLRLDILSSEDSLNLLKSASSKLKEASDQEVSGLAKLCGYLPLALRVAASILNDRPDWSLNDLLTRLTDERTRLQRLKRENDIDLDVDAAFNLSYALLENPLKAFFCQLGVFTAPFIKASAQAVWQLEDENEVDDLIGKLSSLSLLNILPSSLEGVPYMYELHDLTRLFSIAQLLKDNSNAAQTSMRHANHFLRWAADTNSLYKKGNKNILSALFQFRFIWPHLDSAYNRLLPEQTSFPRPPEADEWLSQFPSKCIYMLDLHLSPLRKIPVLETALNAARRLNNREAEGIHIGYLGSAYADLGDAHKAIEFYEKALFIDREIGDHRGEAADLGNLGIAYAVLGDARKAIEFYEVQLVIVSEIGDRRGEGTALGNLGLAYVDLGDARKAIKFYEQALVIDREIGDRRGEGNALGNLGLAYADLGDARKAIEFYEHALVILREIGDRRGESAALGNLGIAYAALDDAHKAIEFYEQALVIDREIGDRRGEGADLGNLGSAYAALGDAYKAIEFYEQALAIDREIGDRRGEGADLSNLGLAYENLGDKERTIQFTEQALAIYEAIESPHAQQARTQLADLRGEAPAQSERP